MEQLKEDMKNHVDRLKEEGVSQLTIEIELLQHIKKIVYPERYQL